MSQTPSSGRHRPSHGRPRPVVATVGALALVAVLAGGGVAAWQAVGEDDAAATDASGSGASESANSGAGASAAPEACDDAATITAADDDVEIATALVAAYGQAESPDCLPLSVSAAAADSDPTLTWAAAGGQDDGAWLARDEVVLAGSDADLETIGWDGGNLTTEALRDVLGTDPEAIEPGSYPDVRITAEDPRASAASVSGLAALAYAAYGGAPTTVDYAAPKAGDVALVRLEQAVDTRDASPEGIPEVALVAASRASGTTVSIEGAPSVGLVLGGDEPEVAALRTWLVGEEGQQAVADAGLTPAADGAEPMTAEATAGFETLWGYLSARLSTVAVLDTSWSMNDPLPGGPARKIDIVKQLATQAYSLASPRARSGVWTFQTSNPNQTPQIKNIATLSQNARERSSGTHATYAIGKVQGIDAIGGTPLYQAVDEAYQDAVERYTPGMTNQLLVMTDGADEDSSSTTSLQDLLKSLEETQDEKRPVRIIVVALNPQENFAEMKQIAEATGGKAVTARNLSEVPNAFEAALFTE